MWLTPLPLRPVSDPVQLANGGLTCLLWRGNDWPIWESYKRSEMTEVITGAR